MTSTLAILGKSGSGKTTVTRAFLKFLKKHFPFSNILLVDNDLSLELSDSFGIKSKNTIYGIKSGKHEYKTGIPDGMSKQEFIAWALEDIIISLEDNIDLISSWFVTPKDCKCISTKLMRDELLKLVERYDFVVFDCEYDLKYLNLLLDCSIDEAIIVSNCKKSDIVLASKIAGSSRKYVLDGKLCVMLNKVDKTILPEALPLLNSLDLDLLGCVENFEDNIEDNISNHLETFYSRMNLPRFEK